jgi:hypothetical protein
MLENVALANQAALFDLDAAEQEDSLKEEVQKMTELDEEEESAGEMFERFLVESMMGLCVDRCSAPRIKVRVASEDSPHRSSA